MRKILLSCCIAISLFSFEIDVTKGWNLKGAEQEINTNLLFEDESIEIIYIYHTDTIEWEKNPEFIDIGQGFWVKSKNNVGFDFEDDNDDW